MPKAVRNLAAALNIHFCMGSLGEQVRALRKARGWSQQELAAQTGGELDQTAISRIETRTGYEPGVFTAATIARAFGLSVDELLAGVTQPEFSPLVETELRLPEGPVRRAIELLQAQVDAAMAMAQEAKIAAQDRAKPEAQREPKKTA